MQYEPKNNIKKPLIITGVIVIVILIITGIGLVFMLRNENVAKKSDDEQEKTAKMYSELFTDEMLMYKELCGQELDWDSLVSKVKKINSNSIVRKIMDDVGQINIGTNKKDEYIRFDIVREEEDSPDTAINFVYYYRIDEENISFVMKNGEKTYQNFNGAVTNEFTILDEALADNLLSHKV